MNGQKDRKSIITINLRRRHLVVLASLFIMLGFAYSFYFKAFMTLPQSAVAILPELDFTLKDKKVLVFSPHCDDETLGNFGVIDRTKKDGGKVKLVMVTDCNHRFNGRTRRNESVQAMAVANVAMSDIEFLDFREGVDKRTPQEQIKLDEIVNRELDDYKPDYIFAPNPSDTHLDHRFIGKTVEKIVTQRKLKPQTAFYLVHYNFFKYPSPPGLKPDSYLLPPAKLVSFNRKWYKFDLTVGEEDQKQEAVLKYKTQLIETNPVLRRVLFGFVRKNELFMMEN